MTPKHIDLIPQGFDVKQALKGIPIVFNNCKISIQVNISPQGGTSLSIKPDSQLESKPLQLEHREPIYISAREASETFELSAQFFTGLIKKHPELGEHNGIRIWLEQEAVRDYLEKHPKHKQMHYAMKKLINVPMLTERAYQILKGSGREMYPDVSHIPTARRTRYMSYAEISRALGVSEGLFYKKIRLPLSQMVKQKPEEVTKKRQEDEEWKRVSGSWGKVIKRDKELGR